MDSKQVEEYIKWAVIELACNAGIDHRNYDGQTRESRLQNYVKETNSVDKAIEQVAQEMVSNQTFNEYYQQYVTGEDDDDDDKFDLENDFFDWVVRFIGLGEISNLHGDNQDNFREKFFSFVK